MAAAPSQHQVPQETPPPHQADPLVVMFDQKMEQLEQQQLLLNAGTSGRAAAAAGAGAITPSTASSPSSPSASVTLESLAASGLLTNILPDRLFFCSLSGHPPSTRETLYFCTDYLLLYSPYFADFGPLNLAALVRYTRALLRQLDKKEYATQRLVHYTNHHAHQRANAGFLMAGFCILGLGMTAAETIQRFEGAYPPFLPFRDASYGVSTFNLTLIDIAHALEKAKTLGWIDVASFDVDEYERYDAVEEGDWNWIVPRQFIAFSSPVDGVAHREVSHVAQAFRDRKIKAVLRLNENLYDRRGFLTLGIDVFDVPFPDGSAPTDGVAGKCLQIMEKTILVEGGGVAVHCKAGLGRTGTVIALFLMKHYGFSAREAIAWCRVCRPGCVIGQQQQYLEGVEHRLRHAPLHGAVVDASTGSVVTPLPSSTMPKVRVSRLSRANALDNPSLTRTTQRLPQTLNAAEAYRRTAEAKAALYDESFVPQHHAVDSFQYASSKLDSLKSAKSATRKALKISSGVHNRRVQSNESDELARLARADSPPAGGQSSSSVSNFAVPTDGPVRSTSSMSFLSASSSRSTVEAVGSFINRTLKRLPVTNGHVEAVLPDVCIRPSEVGLSGPGWLRPTEHPGASVWAARSETRRTAPRPDHRGTVARASSSLM